MTGSNSSKVLPAGWRVVRLSDVCEIQLGKMLSPAAKTGLRPRPYLRNVNVQWGRFDLSEVAEMDFDLDEEEKFSLRPGDLLVCEGGEPGRAAVWQGEISPCFYQKALHRLRPVREAVDPAFVMYRFWLGATSEEFGGSHAKTTIAHLPAVRLAQLSLAIPALEVQQHIVGILNEAFASVERARVATQEQLEAADRMVSLFFRMVFEGPEGRSWPRRPLGEICVGRGQYGTSERANSDGRGIPVLRMGNLVERQIDWSDLRWVELSATEVEKYRLQGGDLLFNRTNSAELVGKSAVFDSRNDAVFASYLIRFRLVRELANPHFVAFYINSEVGRQFIKARMGRAIGQANVSASTMHRMPIPVPPIHDQIRVVAELSERIHRVGRLGEHVNLEASSVRSLPAALLRRAFSGQV